MNLLRVFYSLVYGQLCSVTLGVVTPAQTLSILTDNATSDIHQAYQAYNITATGPSNHLPPEPYYQRFGHLLSAKFYAFFLHIDEVRMDAIYSAAMDEVSRHQHSILPMGAGLQYTWNLTAAGGELALYLYPGDRMTWAIWGLVLHGMKQFMVKFEYVELDFDVLFDPTGPIATGSIEFTMDPE